MFNQLEFLFGFVSTTLFTVKNNKPGDFIRYAVNGGKFFSRCRIDVERVFHC